MAKMFISYSHADEGLRDEIEKHLAMLKREGAIETWHDRRILAGQEIDAEIDAQLEQADVILFLVSQDFLDSRYCYDVEVKRAMERHAAGTAQVIPVILRPCDWHSTAVPFRKLLAIPKDGKPITRWNDRDEALLDVVQRIRAALPPPEMVTIRLPKGVAIPRMVDRPRSSNLRVAKKFTRADVDHFLDDAFAYMVNFFENSLEELKARNPDIDTRYRRIDADSFGCTVYRNGEAVAQCGVRRGTGFGNGIAYSGDDSAPRNSMNEQLTVESDDQAIWLHPMGSGMRSGMGRDSKLTHEGAAEYYWEMLMQPLQQER
jgi:hypothetical protein